MGPKKKASSESAEPKKKIAKKTKTTVTTNALFDGTAAGVLTEEQTAHEETAKESAPQEVSTKEGVTQETASKDAALKKVAAQRETTAKKEAPKKEEGKTEEPKTEGIKDRTFHDEVTEKKRKADEVKESHKAKEAKTEGKKEVPELTEDASGEMEIDAPADKRPQVKDAPFWDPAEVSLNVIPSTGGRILSSVSEGGMQYLLAGARASIGVKAGRYMYEVKIIESLNPSEGGQRQRVPGPKNIVRLGFSAAGSSLFVGDSGSQSICFDQEGFLLSDGKRTSVTQRIQRDQVLAVLLNLDPHSRNANTVSLFRDGERASDPQPLPESLMGQVLFPHVSFRNLTLHVNFGPSPLKALPFKCRMIHGAAQADVFCAPSTSKDGRCEAVFPVGLPDEGTFDWLDSFLERNPRFVELSDRKILDWVHRSGLWKQKSTGWKHSNDKPEFNFGIPALEDLSVQRVLQTVASIVPRNYVVMEVKQNLVASDRKDNVRRFSLPSYTKVAHVVMGEPTSDYKQITLEKLLMEKQVKSDSEWKANRLREERRKQIEAKQRQIEENRRKVEEDRKKSVESVKKKVEEEIRRKEAEVAEKATDGMEGASEEAAYEQKEATTECEEQTETHYVEMASEEQEEKNETEDQMELESKGLDPPIVELSEEERNMWFRTPTTPDLSSLVLSQSFAHFTVPESDEGFDVIRYEWQDADASKEYLRKWVLEKKLTSRIEDLQPSPWFQERLAAWHKAIAEWMKKQKEFNDGKEAAKSKDAPEEGEATKEKEHQETEEKQESVVAEHDDDAEMKDDVDIFSVEDVCNVGNGEPLFSNFSFEDWALLQLRFEFYTLVQAFRHDVQDPERVGVHESHLPFYFNKYYRKQLNAKYFGTNTNQDLVDLVKDTVRIDEEKQVLSSCLAEDAGHNPNIFVKLTEENRRERQRRIDAGDETARLKFLALAMQPPQRAPAQVGVLPTQAAPRPGYAGIRPAEWRPGGMPPVYGQPAYRPGRGSWPGAARIYAPRQSYTMGKRRT